MFNLFDLDGTLIDSNGIWIDVDTEFLRRRGMPYTKEYYQGVAHTIFPLAAKFTKEYCGINDSEESIMAEWMELAGDRYAKRVKLKPYAAEFLAQCSREGIPMAVVTASVPDHCRAALKLHGLEHYFEHLIFAHELGIEKSDPRVYEEVARICGVKPEECTLFDDSIKSCRSAMHVGMQAVGVYDEYFRQDTALMREFCGRYIMSFEELIK